MKPKRPLFNQTTGQILATDTVLLRGWLQQLRGVMGITLPSSVAFALFPCQQVHTWFVREPLDLVYCDAGGTVLLVIPALAPFRLGPSVQGTRVVWEMQSGGFAGKVQIGQQLQLPSEISFFAGPA